MFSANSTEGSEGRPCRERAGAGSGRQSASQSLRRMRYPPAAPNAVFPAVVARVNGKAIPGRDLEERVRRELSTIGNPEWNNLREDYRGQLVLSQITALINSRLLYQKAARSGTKVTEAEVQVELDKNREEL